jgi:hypothetical protein
MAMDEHPEGLLVNGGQPYTQTSLTNHYLESIGFPEILK